MITGSPALIAHRPIDRKDRIMATKKSTTKTAASKTSASKTSASKTSAAAGAAVAPEIKSPEHHAQATESLEPGQHVSEPEVADDVEIAGRSADMSEPSTTHRKVFVLGPSPVFGDNPYTADRGFDHEPNKAATRQYAIDQGMWPTGPVEHKSTKRHPDGESWILTYEIPVIPANDAPDGSQTPRVVAADGDAEGALNYSPPENVAEHGDGSAE
jgi:hypothetical protein